MENDGWNNSDNKRRKKLRKTIAAVKRDSSKRNWLTDVLKCAEKEMPTFTLHDMYNHENDLKKIHPFNKNIKAKIRQQLQCLRDLEVIRFEEPGVYSFIEIKEKQKKNNNEIIEEQRESEQKEHLEEISEEKKESIEQIQSNLIRNKEMQMKIDEKNRMKIREITELGKNEEDEDVKDTSPKLTESELPNNPNENELYELWKHKNISIETLSHKYNVSPNAFKNLFGQIYYDKCIKENKDNMLKSLSPLSPSIKKYNVSYNSKFRLLCKDPQCANVCPHGAFTSLPEGGITRLDSKCDECKTFNCIFSCKQDALYLGNSIYSKAYMIVAKYGETGLLQSDLWKNLSLTSREGSRLSMRLEKNGLIKRKKVVAKGRWTYHLFIQKIKFGEKCRKEQTRIKLSNQSIEQVKELANKYLYDDTADLKIEYISPI